MSAHLPTATNEKISAPVFSLAAAFLAGDANLAIAATHSRGQGDANFAINCTSGLRFNEGDANFRIKTRNYKTNPIPQTNALAPNSHPGLALPTAALHPASTLANSNTASGLLVSLYDFRVRSRCTGRERDAETGLDYFRARYFSGSQGRYTSPDQPFVDQNPFDPQSWNLYGYVRNNPLIFWDPTGQACVVGPDGVEHDDDSGGQSCADAHKPSENNKPSVTVTAQQGSLWEFLTASSVPRYIPNDVPVNATAQVVFQELSKKIDTYPTVCGGGVYGYLGREYTVGPVHGFTGAIGELDSREGASHGVLTELGAGQGIVGGGGATATVNNRSGNVGFGGLIFAGVGAHSDIASASAGVVGFGPKNIGVGIYGELFIDNVGGGGGAYINISTIGNCR